jgi:hypothetical protein
LSGSTPYISFEKSCAKRNFTESKNAAVTMPKCAPRYDELTGTRAGLPPPVRPTRHDRGFPTNQQPASIA